jgi:hypothetical protein
MDTIPLSRLRQAVDAGIISAAQCQAILAHKTLSGNSRREIITTRWTDELKQRMAAARAK